MLVKMVQLQSVVAILLEFEIVSLGSTDNSVATYSSTYDVDRDDPADDPMTYPSTE